MADEYGEYLTFTSTTKDGKEIELAVVDEFEFEKKTYVVGALVTDDTINEDSLFIFRSVLQGEDFTTEKIENANEYQRIAEAYLALEK